MTAPNGRGITWRVDRRYPESMAAGSYEPELVAALAREVRPGSNVLDIGANCGYVALVSKALCGAGQVVAVEPHPVNLDTLDDRCGLNPDLPVEVLPVAVAPESGPVELHLTHNLANPRLGSATWSHEKPVIDELEVPGLAFDEVMRRAEPHVVKIDIEGGEGPVLEASAGPPAWTRPPVVLVECHGAANRRVCDAVASRWGYDAVELQPAAGEAPSALVRLAPGPVA